MARSPVQRRVVRSRPSGGIPARGSTVRMGGYVVPNPDENQYAVKDFLRRISKCDLAPPPRHMAHGRASGRELSHDGMKRRLPLETDAGPVRQSDGAAFDPGVVGKPAEGAEHARIGLRAAQAEAGRDGERHLVAAVRKQLNRKSVV